MNQDPYTLRVLGAGDAPRLAALCALFGEAFEDAGTYVGRPPGRTYHDRLLTHPSFVAVVASRGDETVGGLVAYDLPKPEQARSEFYLYDLAVARPHRRRGIATALIRRLGEIAAERGAWVVFVQADPGDDAAIALYSKLGTREDVHHFDLPVAAQGVAAR